MATVRKAKKKTVKSLDAQKAREKTEKRRKPFPALPVNADGTVSAKYTSSVVVDVTKQSLPPEGMFADWLHYWETARDFYAAKFDAAEKRVDELKGLTAEEREEKRTGIKAHEKAVAAVDNPAVQELAAQKFASDPAAFLASLKDPAAVAQFLAAAQALAMAQQATE